MEALIKNNGILSSSCPDGIISNWRKKPAHHAKAELALFSLCPATVNVQEI